MKKTLQEKNRLAQKLWYERQKQKGNIVYKLTLLDGNTYIGSTTNSLAKRLQQHRAAQGRIIAEDYNLDGLKADILEVVSPENILRLRELYWIEKLKPTLNYKPKPKLEFTPAPKRKTITFQGTLYLTQYELWKNLGKTKLGTFKTRLFRHPGDFQWALGLIELPVDRNPQSIYQESESGE